MTKLALFFVVLLSIATQSYAHASDVATLADLKMRDYRIPGSGSKFLVMKSANQLVDSFYIGKESKFLISNSQCEVNPFASIHSKEQWPEPSSIINQYKFLPKKMMSFTIFSIDFIGNDYVSLYGSYDAVNSAKQIVLVQTSIECFGFNKASKISDLEKVLENYFKFSL